MNWHEVAPPLALIGVFSTLLVTIWNTRLSYKFNRNTSLRMACVDKRLQSHQEAFSSGFKLMWSVPESEFESEAIKCSDWWNNNCLYLDARVRQGYLDLLNNARQYHAKMKADQNPRHVIDNFHEWEKFAKTLFEAIQLPPLAEDSLEIFKGRFSA